MPETHRHMARRVFSSSQNKIDLRGGATLLEMLISLVRAVIYDTWPSYYERDGYDQDGDGLVDEGTNGIDDDNANGVDDAGERETSPPYPAPLRGIEVRIRVMDHSTRQVPQVSVVSDFTRE